MFLHNAKVKIPLEALITLHTSRADVSMTVILNNALRTNGQWAAENAKFNATGFLNRNV
jgi:hypothetical protein